MTTVVNSVNSNATGYIQSDVPMNPSDVANKSYVDLIAAGFTFKASCAAASTANFTSSYSNGAAGVGATLTNTGPNAAFSTDGYSASLNNRILVKNQTSSFQNGIYSVTTIGNGVTPWVLTRTTDYDQPTEILPGTLIPVINGTLNAGTFWVETATVTTIGTDPIVFSQFGTSAISLPLAVNQGGTGLATLSNHSVLVGAATSNVTQIATGSAGQVLQSAGASSDPVFSTATYPSTTTVSQLLYSSATNVVSGLATANSASLVTSSSGVPVYSSTMTNGQVIIGSTGASPTAASLTAGSNITITPGAGSITIASTASGLTWSLITSSGALAVQNGYFVSSGALSLSLPASSAVGDTISVTLSSGTSWTITQGAGQQIRFGNSQTTSGVGGSLASSSSGDAITIVCDVANTHWQSINWVGNILVI
jgi:hypothetical protein